MSGSQPEHPDKMQKKPPSLIVANNAESLSPELIGGILGLQVKAGYPEPLNDRAPSRLLLVRCAA